MTKLAAIARPVIGLAVAISMTAVACSDVKDYLLEPQEPGLITPDIVQTPAAADAMRKGALDRFRAATEGGNAGGLWSMSGLLADEWKSGDTFIQRVETDQRIIQFNNAEIIDEYRAQHRARQAARDAIGKLLEFLPTPVWYQAQMWWVMGHVEMQLAENWCNGVPYGTIVNGIPVYTAPLTMMEGLDLAMTHLDSALMLADSALVLSATDTAAISVRRGIQISRARVFVNRGDFAAAAAAVAGIPTAYRYIQTHSLTTTDVAAWSLNNSQRRWVVGDSFDVAGRIQNAIPFASAGDPRVPVEGTSVSSPLSRAFDNSTWFVRQIIWGRSDAIPLLSGIDARLIEAEERLQANDFGEMTNILNGLRGTPQYLGSAYSNPVMANLAVPATRTDAENLFFREKAFWQFGRGYRLPDLRRLVRQYGRTPDQVFPTGTFFKTNLPYGTDMNFPITTDETPNPLWSGACINRDA
jgi:hypothetical protein